MNSEENERTESKPQEAPATADIDEVDIDETGKNLA